MTQQNDDTTEHEATPATIGKRPYQKPAFAAESVFETMALSCGKVAATQRQCQVNLRNS